MFLGVIKKIISALMSDTLSESSMDMDDQELNALIDSGMEINILLEGLKEADGRNQLGDYVIDLLKNSEIPDEYKISAASQFFETLQVKDRGNSNYKYLLPLLESDKLDLWLKEVSKERDFDEKDIDQYFINVLPWLTPCNAPS